jgi:hypothetical protein
MEASESVDSSNLHAVSDKRTSEELTNADKYGTLLETEFRILELLPGELDDEIHCQFRCTLTIPK